MWSQVWHPAYWVFYLATWISFNCVLHNTYMLHTLYACMFYIMFKDRLEFLSKVWRWTKKFKKLTLAAQKNFVSKKLWSVACGSFSGVIYATPNPVYYWIKRTVRNVNTRVYLYGMFVIFRPLLNMLLFRNQHQ